MGQHRFKTVWKRKKKSGSIRAKHLQCRKCRELRYLEDEVKTTLG